MLEGLSLDKVRTAATCAYRSTGEGVLASWSPGEVLNPPSSNRGTRRDFVAAIRSYRSKSQSPATIVLGSGFMLGVERRRGSE